MQSKKIILIIGVMLITFVLFSVLMGQICKPSQDNAVVSAVSNVLSTPQSQNAPSPVDPFSWEPVLRRLAMFLSKACSR